MRPLLLLLSIACGPEPRTGPAVDADGDHWVNDAVYPNADCDDQDPSIFPRAPELCDGVDNDCDGLIDEDDDVVDAPTWYADGDLDGFGSIDHPWVTCEQPDGYVEDATDCDDRTESINPNGVELCDEVDNDCDGEIDEPGALGPSTFYRDADGDGFGDPGFREEACSPSDGFVDDNTDCDDTRPSINPDAPEVCDAFDRDEDCDGLIDDADDDVTGRTTWYVDADRDTHGVTDTTALACEQPEGFSATADDCDDTNRAVNPSAREVCGDGIDNDCDGLIDGADEAPDVSWYADTDGDGFGDPDAYLSEACDDPGGGSANDGDCDDTDSAVFPGATEVWYDGIDSDCDGWSDFDQDRDGFDSLDFGGTDCDDLDPLVFPGRTDICGDGIDNDCDGVVDACDLDVRLWGEAVGDTAGSALAGAGDVNGDGYADLLVGADREDRGGAAAGAAYLVMGPVSGDQSLADAAAKLVGESTGDHAGISVGGGGDVNGDGYDDLIVGAYDNDAGGASAGAAYLVVGPVSGEVDLSAATARLLGEQPGDFAGYSVAGGGDADGDGVADLLVGAYANDDGGTASGATYLVQGPVSGNLRLWSADAKLTGELAGDQSGWAVAFAGDTDGDGADDILVGAPYAHPGGVYTGALYVVLGGVRGTIELSEADAMYTGRTSGDLVGYSVSAAGDVNNDGFADVLVGGPEEDTGGNDAGAAWLLLGPLDGDHSLQTADATFVGENNDDYAGSAVAGAGDIDSDGFDDLVIGARLDDTRLSNAGAAYLVRGPVSGAVDLATVDAKALGESSSDWAGAAVAGVGDTDLDGSDDVLIGVPFSDDWSSDAGMVWLVLGGGWD